MQLFILGYTNLSRKEMFEKSRLGKLNDQFEFQKDIWASEDDGWTVKFETSWFRRNFKANRYKVIATKA